MTTEITAETLRGWLYDGKELALLDVREPGETILGHILFSAPLPFSRFESGLGRLVPNLSARLVLCDGGDGVAQRAAKHASSMGYLNISCLSGGVTSWADAGHTLYQGVNVPSKAFGELVEHVADTPHLTCSQIAEMQKGGNDIVIVDGRPLEEFAKMSIPGAKCCPNGELALRSTSFAPDPRTTIVVNCAGRTRSIIGAQTLIDMGVPNEVYAMENGTQGWSLAGLQLDTGRQESLPEVPNEISGEQEKAAALANKHRVETISADDLESRISNQNKTVFLLDVRTSNERASDPPEINAALNAFSVSHAPGGQLVQATDQWIGVRNADVIVLDTENVRAPVTAAWLRRIGHKAMTLEGGLNSLSRIRAGETKASWSPDPLTEISPSALASRLRASPSSLLDLRSSAAYRLGHISGAIWCVRPRLPEIDGSVVLIGSDDVEVALAAKDLRAAGTNEIVRLTGTVDDWRAAGLKVEATPNCPSDADRIDFQSFTAGRHDGDRAASRQYLKWEIELVDQLDTDERAVFLL